MKKLLLLFVSSILLLSGCQSQSANAVANPYEIKVGSEILSLYGDKEEFGNNGFEVFDNSTTLSPDINGIAANRKGISCINICDENVVTYKSISVGDDVSKIEDAFDYEIQHNDYSYVVLFNDKNEEVDINSLEGKDNDGTVNISYIFEDSKITRIVIGKREQE